MRSNRVIGMLVALVVLAGIAVALWQVLPAGDEPLLDANEAEALTAGVVEVDDGGIVPLRLGRDVADIHADGWLTVAQDDDSTRIEPPSSGGAGPVSAQVIHVGVDDREAPAVQLTAWAVDGEVISSQAALTARDSSTRTGDGVGLGLGVPWSNVEDRGEQDALTVSTPSGESVWTRIVRWQDGGVRYSAADLGSDLVAWLEVARADALDCELDAEAWARVAALDPDHRAHPTPFATSGPVEVAVIGTPVTDLGVELKSRESASADPIAAPGFSKVHEQILQ